MIDGGT
jgi:putative ABC transport system substrate-binding protein